MGKFNKGCSSIPGCAIPSDWSILTGFIFNTRSLLMQIRNAIWRWSETFQCMIIMTIMKTKWTYEKIGVVATANRYWEDLDEEATKNKKCKIMYKMVFTGLHNCYGSWHLYICGSVFNLFGLSEFDSCNFSCAYSLFRLISIARLNYWLLRDMLLSYISILLTTENHKLAGSHITGPQSQSVSA